MKIDISKKRRETILFAITVILLAFLISIISNIVFSEFYIVPYKVKFTILIFVSIILTSLFGYFKVLSQSEGDFLKVKFLLTFNRSKKQFIDIPYCVSSVNARVLFHKLPKDKQEKISQFHIFKRDDSMNELEAFIDNVVQYIILTRILRFSSRIELKKFPASQLPSDLRNNICFDESDNISIPTQLNIESVNDWIRLTSVYGNIDFRWNCDIGNKNHWTACFLKVIKPDDKDEYFDCLIEVTMLYKCKFWLMFSRNLDRFLSWIDLIERELKEYEWAESERQLMFLSLKEIASGLADVKNKF